MSDAEVDRHALAADNLALVSFVLKRSPAFVDCLGWDEAVSAGNVGLVKAANGYKPDRGTFANYACHCIRNFVSDECRRKNRHHSEPLGSVPLAEDRAVDHWEMQQDVQALLKRLPRGDRKLLRDKFGLRCGREESDSQLAERYGVSRITVRERTHRALTSAMQQLDKMHPDNSGRVERRRNTDWPRK